MNLYLDLFAVLSDDFDSIDSFNRMHFLYCKKHNSSDSF